jgi:hypothetical protein
MTVATLRQGTSTNLRLTTQGYDAVSLGEPFPTFGRNAMPQKRRESFNDMASSSRRLESSEARLWELHMSQTHRHDTSKCTNSFETDLMLRTKKCRLNPGSKELTAIHADVKTDPHERQGHERPPHTPYRKVSERWTLSGRWSWIAISLEELPHTFVRGRQLREVACYQHLH